MLQSVFCAYTSHFHFPPTHTKVILSHTQATLAQPAKHRQDLFYRGTEYAHGDPVHNGPSLAAGLETAAAKLSRGFRVGLYTTVEI